MPSYSVHHFRANSLPGSNIGMKFGAKALVRPFEAVPTTLLRGICIRPRDTRPRAFIPGSISSSTGR